MSSNQKVREFLKKYHQTVVYNEKEEIVGMYHFLDSKTNSLIGSLTFKGDKLYDVLNNMTDKEIRKILLTADIRKKEAEIGMLNAELLEMAEV